MLKILSSLVDQGFVNKTKLTTVRVKLHTPRQWKCFFCHMEGNKESESITDVPILINTLQQFKKKLHLSEVHLTGGEPSLHPKIVEIIQELVRVGFTVKMTTNGQTKLTRYIECVNAGLSELNISIHTLNPLHLGKMMYPSKDIVWGAKAVQKQMHFIKEISPLTKLKINTCVDDDESDALAIAELAKIHKLSWRAMNVLENPEESYAALDRMCKKLRATAVEAGIIEGSSSCSVQMHCTDGFDFKVKLIHQNYLQSMCSGCELDKDSRCFEYYYGPRLEAGDNTLLVRNCVHRNGNPFVLSVEDFFNSTIYKDIKNRTY